METLLFREHASEVPKLKSTCENCVRAKVKCTGPPGPCERCSGWRKLDCVFVEERKRGRPRLPEEQKKYHNDAESSYKWLKNDSFNHEGGIDNNNNAETKLMEVCTKPNHQAKCEGPDCWTQVVDGQDTASSSGEVGSMLVAPSSGLSPEQGRLVEIFFQLYKNHAAPHSCCRAWFSRQLNKIVAMLRTSKSHHALLSMIEWMNRHQIMVEEPQPPSTTAFKDPDSGLLLPPMTSSRGPLLNDKTIQVSPSQPTPAINESDSNCICLRISYDRNENCSIRTTKKFDELFGLNAQYFQSYVDTLNGGILPWGADVFANLLYRPLDTVVLIRLLAYRFLSQPRMTQGKPVTRHVQSKHLFACKKADGTVLDCISQMEHTEHVSYEGVAVEIKASFEPYTPKMASCDFDPATNMFIPLVSPVSLTPDVEDTTAQNAAGNSTVNLPEKKQSADFNNDTWLDELLRWVDEEDPVI